MTHLPHNLRIGERYLLPKGWWADGRPKEVEVEIAGFFGPDKWPQVSGYDDTIRTFSPNCFVIRGRTFVVRDRRGLGGMRRCPERQWMKELVDEFGADANIARAKCEAGWTVRGCFSEFLITGGLQ